LFEKNFDWIVNLDCKSDTSGATEVNM